MEILFSLLFILGGLVLFDLAAVNLGHDSRQSVGDDHGRRIERGGIV